MSKDFEALTLEDSHWKKIARWFQIDVRVQDQKLVLKPSQLYTMFVSQGLISTVRCLSFVKCEEELSLEKFFLPPLYRVVNQLKRKREASSKAQTPFERKSQNVESSTSGSSIAHNILSKTRFNGHITKSSAAILTSKPYFIQPTASIDLTNITDKGENVVQHKYSDFSEA